MSAPLSPNTPEALEQLAHRRARAKLGWWVHATVYLLVNLGLMVLSWHQGRHWAVFPALGWGLGLAMHGRMLPGSAAMERLVARERAQLQARQVQPPQG